MNKPLTVQIEETKQNLVNVINNSGLHPYILDNILKGLYDEMHILLTNMTKQEVDEYNKAIAEEKGKG